MPQIMQNILIPILSVVAIIMAYLAFFRRRITDISDQLPNHSGKQYGTRTLSQIKRLIVHHSASEGQTAYDYAAYHIQEKQWPGIGYHYVIQPAGEIFQTNHLTTNSYHTQGFNTEGIGICLSGNLSNHPMTDTQEKSLIWLLRKLRKDIPSVVAVSGHRDHKNTSCPGDYTDLDKIIGKL